MLHSDFQHQNQGIKTFDGKKLTQAPYFDRSGTVSVITAMMLSD